jgi:hypothetical protein
MIVALSAMFLAMSSTPATRLGPIFLDEPIAAVRKLLGPGTRVSTCPQKKSDCLLKLDYGDGKNVLKLEFELDYLTDVAR